MTFKSAYLKLTAFYVLIVMIISVFFSLVLYRISSNELNQSLRQQMRNLQELQFFEGSMNYISDFELMRLQQLAQANHNLKYYLIYFNSVIFVVSFGLGYFLAKRTLKPIRQMMESQNRFTADASHELRTPLTAMKSEIEVNLRDQNLNLENAKKLLRSNLEEVEKLENLSSSLLKLANYENNKNLAMENVALEDIIAESYLRVERQAKEKQITFENDLKNIKINGNRDSLIQLFKILLDNAIKYSKPNSKIFILMDKIGNDAVIKVRDQGMGIEEEDLKHIFDRFYRTDLSRSKNKNNGYGLGLSIAMQIVKMHKGKINVESQINQGSEFTVILPA
ncbi:MAG: HAMP domain-containing sensor histidine kinase [Patescibacteria group bacterium]|nr:HAMP domain-containing sensor histidine kinase [Patescibacteria group bacterium]